MDKVHISGSRVIYMADQEDQIMGYTFFSLQKSFSEYHFCLKHSVSINMRDITEKNITNNTQMNVNLTKYSSDNAA